jgi:hypothetical protein
MSAIEIRPRFTEVVPMNTEEVLERLHRALDDPSAKIKGSIFDHHVRLKIPFEDQHYWSPQLSLILEEEGDSTLIRGLFGPRSSVWLMFVFFYSTIGAICLFVAITGFSQLSLGIPAPVLWVIPIGAILALALYLMAKAGERLGKEEMRLLKNFLDGVLVISDRQHQTDTDGKTILNTGT